MAKYSLTIHGEMNAILNAKEDLTGWALYVTAIPCNDCIKHIAQAGIKKIVYIDTRNNDSQLNYDAFLKICTEMSIEVIAYE
jgi:dCMP deaminase